MKIDKADVVILNTLQENARTSLDKLAHLAGLSTASVQRRLRALRDSGVIVRDVSILDPSKLDQHMSFIVMVELERERRDQIDLFVRQTLNEILVQQCYYVTGEADFCLICTAKDMHEFEELTHRLFFENSNVRRFRTSVVMGRKKIGLEVSLENLG
ncbi:Lrp/AsnC family transcriptional regulator [Falsihalocynthiibacter sp. S25ZX9]|uniref:Lrp/AsnC family transcriptional regulator n=1 Tax=Falsihalocynthiibacter sp. S25ZX9 TaxID=3240870 RepID=UPI00350F6D63